MSLIIPIVFKERLDIPQSFSLKDKLDPKKIVKKFPVLTFNKILNQFAFCLENGTEFKVNCINTNCGSSKKTEYNCWIEIWDSLNVVEDVNFIGDWLLTNFKV